MSIFSYLTNADTVLELIESVQNGIIVIDENCRVVMLNRAAREMLGQTPDCLGSNKTCYNLLLNKDNRCPECPAFAESATTGLHKSIVIKRGDKGDLFAKVHFSRWMDHIVLTFHDVTREVALLREIDLGRKELQAKNVLIERRSNEILEERRNLETLWNYLPEPLVTVDELYNIKRKNAALSDMQHASNAVKCYELAGNDYICDGCPVVNGFDFQGELKKSHRIGDEYFTEIIMKSPVSKGGLLQFRNITRQIDLIGKIKEQQESIEKKNHILSSLVNFSARMQKDMRIDAVASFFLDIFLPLIKVHRAVLLVNDIRPGNIWITEQREVEEETISTISRSYLGRKVQGSEDSGLSTDLFPWEATSQVVLAGLDGKRVGLLLLNTLCAGKDEEILKLFTEPLGAYIHNQLLMKKLEEKANTDALTGLYNRNFLDQALKEENQKLLKYKIDYSVVVADVNGLKKANDIYGHEAGDKLIITVGRLFKDASRMTDVVVRTGGDEFLLLLTDTSTENALAYIRRITKNIFNDAFIDVGDGEKFPVTVSLGAAGTDCFAPEVLIKEADRRMYEAKEEFYKTREKYR